MESPVPQKPTAPPPLEGLDGPAAPGRKSAASWRRCPRLEAPGRQNSGPSSGQPGPCSGRADSAVAPARALESFRGGGSFGCRRSLLALWSRIRSRRQEAAAREARQALQASPCHVWSSLSPGFGTAAPGLRGGLEPLPGGPGPPHPQAGRAGGPAEGASGGAGRSHGKPRAPRPSARSSGRPWRLGTSGPPPAGRRLRPKGTGRLMEAVTAGLEEPRPSRTA